MNHHNHREYRIENPGIYVPIRHLSSVICLLSSVFCLLSSVFCHLSSVICRLSSVVCHLSSVICLRPSTSVENPLQINLFMQNKPNFRKSQMNANLYNTTDYERKRDWTLGENKPNSNPNKPNLRKAKMNVNLTLTKDYRKKDDFEVRINKPCPERSRMGQFPKNPK